MRPFVPVDALRALADAAQTVFAHDAPHDLDAGHDAAGPDMI